MMKNQACGNICFFFKKGLRASASTSDRADPDYAILAEARAILHAATDVHGRRLVVVVLLVPPRRLDERGRPLALSYVSFYLANSAVIMPGFDAATDVEAARVLAAAFPDHEVVVVPGQGIADGGGNIHCIHAAAARMPNREQGASTPAARDLLTANRLEFSV